MVSSLISIAAVIAAISLAVLAGSAAIVVRRWPDASATEPARTDGRSAGERTSTGVAAANHREEDGTVDGETIDKEDSVDTAREDDRPGGETREAVLLREKLRAYREIMDAAVSLNRAALELNEEEFRHAADAIAFDQESELREPYLDANEAFESNLYIISEEVRQATSEYVDYLATYHDEGAHAGGLLGRAGDIYEAMRSDLGLETLFGEDAAPPKHGDGDIMPDPSDEEPDIEDFTEELGKPEDLEYFSGGRSSVEAEDENGRTNANDETDDADEVDPRS
ncbi:MAG: hypothetical protein ABEH65_02825 [Halobacteriales archaeon]